MEADGLTELDVAESILNAVAIHKRLRSRSPFRKQWEYLYVHAGNYSCHNTPANQLPAQDGEVYQ
jgi:hypothetical protein